MRRLLERAREHRLRIDVAQHQHVGARETQRGARELAGHDVLAAGREHRPEIVRMRVGSAADEAQDAHRHAEHGELLDIKGENPDRRAALERDQDAQRLPGAVDLPPLVLEQPGIEHARRHRLRMDAVPFGRQARELVRRGEELDGDFAAGGAVPRDERSPRGEPRNLRRALMQHASRVAQKAACGHRLGGCAEWADGAMPAME